MLGIMKALGLFVDIFMSTQLTREDFKATEAYCSFATAHRLLLPLLDAVSLGGWAKHVTSGAAANSS